jgi:hypothetical protein
MNSLETLIHRLVMAGMTDDNIRAMLASATRKRVDRYLNDARKRMAEVDG